MDIEQIQARIAYDPLSGEFFWVKARIGMKRGQGAGSITDQGYVTIKVAGVAFKAHRLAWLLTYGEMPAGIIDHINGVRTDNRIANLRVVSASQNRINAAARCGSKSGIKGVSWAAREKKWSAQINIAGKKRFLGYFTDAAAAKGAYDEASNRHHGEFARAG